MELIYCTELPQYLEQDPKRVMTLDIETTGFVPPQDEILSLAIIDGNEYSISSFRMGASPKICGSFLSINLCFLNQFRHKIT